ncbi:GIY-YIG nuclease family protein [Arthrobacter mobilis]|uniref:GIY-YIG domain-containing protein n=1 Tax=Arthrobacter mobilis TaxID=2724944 RepID=A0A7X6K6J6_9MICC|nr:GIY-YIG nuclease family protein [Arthrobacter mobilis]NKX55929.1 hypothetical protein [Arthrobacter mobilis]
MPIYILAGLDQVLDYAGLARRPAGLGSRAEWAGPNTLVLPVPAAVPSKCGHLQREDAMVQDRQTTVVYRLYDSEHKLIYIGMSGDPYARFDAHRREYPLMWRMVEEFEWDEYETRQEAAYAEKVAILLEMPPYNRRKPKILRYTSGGPKYRVYTEEERRFAVTSENSPLYRTLRRLADEKFDEMPNKSRARQKETGESGAAWIRFFATEAAKISSLSVNDFKNLVYRGDAM